MIKVAVVGGTGYTGVELLRLLVRHPEVEISAITSRGQSGTAVDELFPSLRGHCDLSFCEPNARQVAGCDLVFFATPHGVAHEMVPELLAENIRVIDLSADFRIRDAGLWSKWYGQPHGCPELLDKVVYGLPEFNRRAIADAQLVACPGCYPTSVLLGFLPLLEKALIDASDLVANSASGASGAGRQANVANLLSETSDSFKAYACNGHRHLPEIEQGLSDIAGGGPVRLTFVPHLLPIVRGIHTTLYANLTDTSVDLQQLFETRYADEPFVDVLPPGAHPETRSVRGSNMCRIGVFRPGNGDKAVVLVVEDNLVKGASGQAVQNMNIMFGLAETRGLEMPALMP